MPIRSSSSNSPFASSTAVSLANLARSGARSPRRSPFDEGLEDCQRSNSPCFSPGRSEDALKGLGKSGVRILHETPASLGWKYQLEAVQFDDIGSLDRPIYTGARRLPRVASGEREITDPSLPSTPQPADPAAIAAVATLTLRKCLPVAHLLQSATRPLPRAEIGEIMLGQPAKRRSTIP